MTTIREFKIMSLMLHNAGMRENGQDRKAKDRKARLVLSIGNFSIKPGWFPEPLRGLNCQKPPTIQLVTYSGLWEDVGINTNTL